MLGFVLWIICWVTFFAVAIAERAFDKKMFAMGVFLSVVLFLGA